MYKDTISLANTALKGTTAKFNEDEKQFVVFYAYKTGDMTQVQLLIKEMEKATEPGEMEDIFRRYSKQMNLKGGIEHLSENLLVCIERYRLEQENAIGYLATTLNLNGISISDEEIRQGEMMELKDKIAKEAAEKGVR